MRVVAHRARHDALQHRQDLADRWIADAAIDDGRKRLQAAGAEREKTANAMAQTEAASTLDPSAVLARGKDAGPPQDPYGAGASIAEMNGASGGCLVAAEPFQENGTGVKGTIYRMAPSPACGDKLAGFV